MPTTANSTAHPPAERQAWMSLLGKQGLAKPVKVALDGEFLSIYSNSRSLAISSPTVPAGDAPMLANVAHKSVAVPHPLLATKPVAAEAVAHLVLFSDASDIPPMDAVVLSCPVADVANYMSLYIELLLTKGLEGALPADQAAWFTLVSSRVGDYTVAALGFTGICLNSPALAAVLKMVSTLGSVDAQQAESLKMWVAKTQSDAQTRVKVPSSITGSNSAPSKFGARLSQLGVSPRLLLEPGFAEVFAKQVVHFHRSVWRNWNPLTDPSLAFQTPTNSSAYWLNPLVFDFNANPHFLGVIFAQHIFSMTISDVQRARLLEKWIVVAHELYSLGDFVGWTAIVLNLYDVSCLRLTHLWSLVDQRYVSQYARDWEFECFEIRKRARLPFLAKSTFRHTEVHPGAGSSYGKQELVPYLVDMIVHESKKEGDTELVVKQLQRLTAISSSWQAYLAQIPGDDQSVSSTYSQIEPDETFQRMFHNLSQQSLPPLDLMSLSHTVQPKFMGYYLPHFYHQALPFTSGAMLPVLFTPSVPTFRLFPRNTLLLGTLPKQASRPQPLRRSSSFPSAARPQITGVSELDTGARDQLENTASAHVLAKVVRDLLNVGTETVDTHAGLVFKLFQPEDTKSYRSSRTSSIIETFNRRASFRPTSSRTQSSNHSHQLESSASAQKTVSVKSASLVKLVDVLVLGAGVFSPGATLDTAAHTEVLLATYRSFCSPAELLDMLQMRVRCCRGAAKILAETPHFPLSANQIETLWQPRHQPNDPVNHWAITILGNIVNMLNLWVNDYFFDFSDDKFVLSAGTTLIATLVEKMRSIKGYPTELVHKVERLNGSFYRHLYSRPSVLPRSIVKRAREANGTQANGPKTVVVELPSTSLEQDEGLQETNIMVDELDGIVADAFNRITLTDWMKLFEKLEVQACRRTGLFMYSSTTSSESETVVQDVFSWLATLQSNDASNMRVLEQLPESIAFLVRFHSSLVAYFASQICDPTLAHPHERRERMVTLLKMLGILRTRMKFLNLSAQIDPQQQDEQHIPSFLESALVSAMLLPESRAYANSWLAAGEEVAKLFPANRGQRLTQGHSNGETVPNLRSIFIPSIPPTSGKPVTLCAGWIIERFLEIVGCVPNISIENQALINFDKYRYAYNLVKNMCIDLQDPTKSQTPESVLAKYSFLFEKINDNRNASVPTPLVDRKLHKESVSREGKVRHRIFTDIVSKEMDKAKAEVKQRDRLERASMSSSSGHPLSSSSFYGLPASQSSASLSLRRNSKLMQSSSTMDVSSYLDSNANDTSSIQSGYAPSSSAATPRRGSHHNQKKSRLGGLFSTRIYTTLCTIRYAL